MKLIVTGATGFVATEVIRQALQIAKITSVVAPARQQVQVSANIGLQANAQKLHSVVMNDYSHYSEITKNQLTGADACIW